MEQFQLRLIDEFIQLNERINNLYQFVNTNETFKTLEQAEQDDLGCQLNAMVLYQRFLQQRIFRANLVDEVNKALKEKYNNAFTQPTPPKADDNTNVANPECGCETCECKKEETPAKTTAKIKRVKTKKD